MDASTKLWYLENFNLLESLNMAEKMSMSEKISDKSLEKGQVIYFPGDTSATVYFLKKGKVKISKISDEGKEMIIAILGPGEIFGELAIAGQEEHDQIAEATEDAMICSMSIQLMEEMLEQYPKLNLSMTKLIGLRLKKVQSRLEALCFKSAPQRIKHYIKELVEEYGRDVGYEKEVKLSLTHQDIANLTATTRQTVTLVMRELEKDNIILYDRRRILVRDMNALN
ncbi:MAG: hypothetical protein COA57_10510 [Flavobacteriales bacterium]|nr:MAG: hypothetical protein COA57_10510 [Flavobacteriales bacterium]